MYLNKLKYSISAILFVAVILSIFSCDRDEKQNNLSTEISHIDRLIQRLNHANDSTVMVVAHRGDWRNFPENSIPAIQSCINMGVDMVEIDLEMTKDSIFVLMHDHTLDRTTTGEGFVADFTYDQIHSLQLRDGAGQSTEWKVPTLEDVLTLCRGRILIDLDKSDKFIDQIYPMLKESGCIDQIIIGSYRPYEEMKQVVGIYLDSIYFMPKIDEESVDISEFLDGYFRRLNAPVVSMNFSSDSSIVMKYVPKLYQTNKWIWTNAITDNKCAYHHDNRATYDTHGSYGWLVDNGFNMIQTDRPALLLKYLREKGLHD